MTLVVVFPPGARRQFFCRMKTGNKACLNIKYEKDAEFGDLGQKKKKSGEGVSKIVCIKLFVGAPAPNGKAAVPVCDQPDCSAD